MKKSIKLLVLGVLCSGIQNGLAQKGENPFSVEISGTGSKSIVFIPGFASSGGVWDDTRVMYEKDFICYTLTMEGFAGVPAQQDPTFKSWEDAIASYIKDSGMNKPIIIGHSMGGGLAMALAADYTDLISKIVVVDGLPCLAALMDPSFKTQEENDCNEMITRITGMSDEQFLASQRNTISSLVADTTKLKTVLKWSMASDRNTFAKMYCDFSNIDLREKIANIQCPALILMESYFANFKPQINDQFKNLKTADIRYADKGLHFIMYDNPEWYKAQLTDFIVP